jgi:hypothetical protein
MYNEYLITLINISSETMVAKDSGMIYLKCRERKEQNCHLRILYLAKLF